MAKKPPQVCVCGTPLSKHFDSRGTRTPCAQPRSASVTFYFTDSREAGRFVERVMRGKMPFTKTIHRIRQEEAK